MHSAEVDAVWRTAAREAAASLYRYVEPEHLLVALFALEKSARLCTESNTQSPHEDFEELRRLYAVVGLEPEAAAESLRKRIGTQGYKHTLKVVHRSEACKSVFHRANGLTRTRGETTVRCIHVLAALLEDPSVNLRCALRDCRIDIDALRRNVAGAVHKRGRQPTAETREAHGTDSPAHPEAAPPALPSDTPCLVKLKGNQEMEQWPLRPDRPLVIGRACSHEVSVDIDLRPDARISPLHARIWFSDGSWWIEDLNSTNGTSVGGSRIASQTATALDTWKEVRIGDTLLMLVPPDWHRLYSSGLVVDLEISPVINLGVFHCSPVIVSRLVVTNRSSSGTPSRALSFSVSEYATAAEVALPPLAPGQIVELSTPKFHWNYDALESRVEKSYCVLAARLGESPLQGPPVEVCLLPANEWACGRTDVHQMSLASFVLPNHPSIERLVGAACMHLPADNDAEAAIQAIYDHLLGSWSIGYTFEPVAWRAGSQKIRFPHQVLLDFIERRGHGTCIDLALLVAACLESLRHEPLIAVVDMGGNWHSLVGCRRSRKDGLEPLLFDKEAVLAAGVWVDPNGCTHAPEFGWKFSQSRSQAESALTGNPLVFALDVAAARKVGRVEPLPFSGQPDLSREVRAAVAEAYRIGHNMQQAPGTVHILVGLLTVEDGLTREAFREAGVPADQAVERLTAGLGNVRGRDEDGLSSTRHHDIVLSGACSLAKRAGLNVVLERFALEALLLTPSSALDNALRNLGTSREALQEVLRKVSSEFKTHPSLPSEFPTPM